MCAPCRVELHTAKRAEARLNSFDVVVDFGSRGLPIIKHLVGRGGEVTALNRKNGMRPLHSAATAGFIAIAEYLASSGAEVAAPA